MSYFVNSHNIFGIVLITFIVSATLIPIVRKIAFHLGAVDKPDGKRKIHKSSMPTMGGLAIYGAFLVGYMLFAPESTQMLSVLIGGFVIILTGILDDIKPLPAKVKFVGQIIAALIVAFYGQITFNKMQVFGLPIEFGIFAKPITVLFIVSIINAINLCDGLDGLAGGTSVIYFITIAIIAYIGKHLGGLDVILCLIMIGSILGFLVYNFPPASIFMGDTGSMFLGFIISIVALLGFKTATITSLIIPVLVLFVPIFDTLLAIARRTIKGESIAAADKEHLHHQLLRTTKSSKKTVLLMYLIDSIFAAISVLYTLGDSIMSMILYACILLFFIILIFKTDILFEHKKRD